MLNIVGGGIDVFGVAHLPVDIPIGFALQFRYPQAESGVTREVRLTTLDPSLQIVGQPTTFEVTPQLGEFHAEGWLAVYTVTGGIELTVEAEGTHSLGIQIDGFESGAIPFQVFLADDEADDA